MGLRGASLLCQNGEEWCSTVKTTCQVLGGCRFFLHLQSSSWSWPSASSVMVYGTHLRPKATRGNSGVMSEMDSLLSFRNVRLEFDTEQGIVHALRGLDLDAGRERDYWPCRRIRLREDSARSVNIGPEPYAPSKVTGRRSNPIQRERPR